MGLREYKQKRHFNRTPEPEGKTAPASGRSYVIQKHAASHLHYDFRLELEGVLKSWAVPKGPSLDPTVKRLAMHVEDHPVQYGSFEGTIPKGEYGGGTVMLWDRGTWEPLGNPHEAYRQGRLKFKLHGQKLHGAWMLLRTGNLSQTGKDDRKWLLFKERDEEAQPASDDDITEKEPRSVSTGRSLDEIASDRDWVWNSKSEKNVMPKSYIAKNGIAKPKRAARKGTSRSTPRQAEYDSTNESFAGVRLTSPNKILYPEDGITKLELAAYYHDVAKWMLPHIINRPLVLVRCPEGRDKECFFQKHPGKGTPDTLRQIPVRESSTVRNYVVVDDVAGLISLAQVGALEIHAGGSRADKLEQPDRLIFDLDPDPELSWKRVVAGARQVRQFLDELGLETFVKTTGGKGLHIVVPIARRLDWDQVKPFCKRVADLIVAADPGNFTANMAKAVRGGKIFIDYLRNGRGATAIVPYSTRARPGATISAPITWEELAHLDGPNHLTIRNIRKRLASLKNDPWKRISSVRQGLTGPLKKLEQFSHV
jgi:bifunctional non-homologous end joining protein LigD